MRAQRYPHVLSIAGSDSGGGAGIQADVKTFAALGCYGMTAITALTAQNTLGVRAIHAVPLQMLRDQIDAVVEDIGVDAVKIGMLHAADVVHTVALALDAHQLRTVVLDPVMVAANGAPLISEEAIADVVTYLFPRACVVTPNLDEAALLLGAPITSREALPEAAHALLAMGAQAVLLKGAHLPGEDIYDIFVSQTSTSSTKPVTSDFNLSMSSAMLTESILPTQIHTFSSKRIVTTNLHGAGCTLSSAIAAYLALGLPMLQAIMAANTYVRAALAAGANVKIGQGVGPLNHGFAPLAMHQYPIESQP